MRLFGPGDFAVPVPYEEAYAVCMNMFGAAFKTDRERYERMMKQFPRMIIDVRPEDDYQVLAFDNNISPLGFKSIYFRHATEDEVYLTKLLYGKYGNLNGQR